MNSRDYERFAWLPLSLEAGWVWDTLFSLGVLPLLALGVLSAQLWRFHFLEWGPGLFTLAAALGVSFLNWKSIRQIGKLRGQVHRYYGVPLIVTYHPAALLRNPSWKRPTWEDVQLARRILDRALPAGA